MRKKIRRSNKIKMGGTGLQCQRDRNISIGLLLGVDDDNDAPSIHASYYRLLHQFLCIRSRYIPRSFIHIDVPFCFNFPLRKNCI